MLPVALFALSMVFVAAPQAPSAPAAAPQQTSAAMPPAAPQPDPVVARFVPLWRKCVAGLSGKAVTQATADDCKAAAVVAEEFPAGTHVNDRRLAFMYAATAEAHTYSPADALRYADKAVRVVQQANLTGGPAESAYSLRAGIKLRMGIAANPTPDAENAVTEARRMVKAADPNGKARLKADLLFLADIMQNAGRLADAGAVRVEADSL